MVSENMRGVKVEVLVPKRFSFFINRVTRKKNFFDVFKMTFIKFYFNFKRDDSLKNAI